MNTFQGEAEHIATAAFRRTSRGSSVLRVAGQAEEIVKGRIKKRKNALLSRATSLSVNVFRSALDDSG